MDLLSTAFLWLTHTTAAWLIAGIVAGAGVTLMERHHRRQAPSTAAVHHTATQYRLYYGPAAIDAITDHKLSTKMISKIERDISATSFGQLRSFRRLSVWSRQASSLLGW